MVACVRTVNIILMESIVTNVNQNSIDRMGNSGMRPTCAIAVIATGKTLLEIAKNRPDDVNVNPNTKNQIVYHVHSDILDIQIVVHVNAISMEQRVIIVNHQMESVHVRQILPVIFVKGVQPDSMDLNVCLVNVI